MLYHLNDGPKRNFVSEEFVQIPGDVDRKLIFNDREQYVLPDDLELLKDKRKVTQEAHGLLFSMT